MVSNTGFSCACEPEIAARMSAVAVCCWSVAQLHRALPQFIEQARVLDGNYRLRRKVLDQVDLLVSEGSDLLPVDDNGAYQLAFFEHWNGKHGASTGKLD